MTELPDKKSTSGKSPLIQYVSVGSQLFAGIITAVFAGWWIDKKLHFSFPVLVWLLPLIFIVGMILKVIKDT